MMPKQKGARKVSKAEMVNFIKSILRPEPHIPCACPDSHCPEWVVPGIKGGMCEDCSRTICVAIVALIKAHKEA